MKQHETLWTIVCGIITIRPREEKEFRSFLVDQTEKKKGGGIFHVIVIERISSGPSAIE